MRVNVFEDSKRNQKCNFGDASNEALVERKRVHDTYMYICAQIKARTSTIVY